MKRRQALARAAVAFVATSPLVANAQGAARLPRVALVFFSVSLADLAGPDPVDADARQFVHGLRDLGLVDGRHIVIERRSAQGQIERLSGLMRELVAQRVDVIVAAGPGVVHAQRATTTIPIVALIDDPVAMGLTISLARPSGNVTGVTTISDDAIYGKRLQLLKEAVPKIARVAMIDFKYVDSQRTPGTHRRRRAAESAARELGLALIPMGASKLDEIEPAFGVIASERADALMVMDNAITYDYRQVIVDIAARQRLPAIYPVRESAESGGLMSYGLSDDLWRRMAAYVDKILKGAKPADLPWEQPKKYEFVINLKTAKAMGLAIPQALLFRADEVLR